MFAARTLQQQCFGAAFAAGWHHDLKSGELKQHNKGERLMLIVTELAEAYEGARKGLMDDKLPLHPMHAVELADTVIRCFDEAGVWGYDLGAIIAEKMLFNTTRPDHKREARLAPGGKKD